MRWLLHGSLDPAVAQALVRHEQVAEAAEADLPPAEILELARKRQLEIITAETSLTDLIFAGDGRFSRVIVHLNVGAGEVEQDDAVDRLFQRYPRLKQGQLYTVTGARVKVRQLPTSKKLGRAGDNGL